MRRPPLAQHFLWDSQVTRRAANVVSLKGLRVLEVGAGTGALTVELARQKPEKLVAVETDAELIVKLNARVRDWPNVSVVHHDVRQMDFSGFDLVAGNIPFYLSSELIFKTLESGADALFFLQKEFADRLVAQPGSSSWGRLSVNAQNHADVRIALDVPRFAFSPPPAVDACVVVLKRKAPEAIDEKLVEALFSHKNQKIQNAFEHSARKLGLKKDEAKTISREMPFSQERVRRLTLSNWLTLSDFLKKKKKA
ncbi:ribosomal RNA small subunit methyltransferase A [Candidatus Micrarchaeota archaeon]|nr:ribosomal RNA small subunit methyltransferase A [Candidatus Micrarchaeota archaeon]